MVMNIFRWLGAEEDGKYLVLASWICGAALVIFNFVFIRDLKGYESYFSILNLAGPIIALVPSAVVKYQAYQKRKEIERRFPAFLRDVTEGTKSGMALPEAIKKAGENDYGPLTPHVKKIAAQIDWGVPFEEVLKRFSERTKSDILSRTVSTIIETHRSGGNVSEVLEVVGDSIMQIERIKEERKSHVYSQMVTGYTIYFVFLGIMVGLQKFLLPSLMLKGAGAGIGMGGGMRNLTEAYREIFKNLVLIQGFFSGISIGKMSEGSILAGFHHVVILIAIGYTTFFVLL